MVWDGIHSLYSSQVIVFGFFFEETAYLRSGFNILDFVIVLVSVLSVTQVSILSVYMNR